MSAMRPRTGPLKSYCEIGARKVEPSIYYETHVYRGAGQTESHRDCGQ